jgi:hypothetical protein
MVGGLILGVFLLLVGVALIYFAPVIGNAMYDIYIEIESAFSDTFGKKCKSLLPYLSGTWMGPLLFIWQLRIVGIFALSAAAIFLYFVLSGEIVINL